MKATIVKFFEATGTAAGKLTDAALHFIHGPLAGLKLVGLSTWQGRNAARHLHSRSGATRPSQRRIFALLRSIADLQPSVFAASCCRKRRHGGPALPIRSVRTLDAFQLRLHACFTSCSSFCCRALTQGE